MAAGFLLLAAPCRADDAVPAPPPARSIALTPVQGADAAEVSALGDKVERLVSQALDQAARLDAQARSVSVGVQALEEHEARLKKVEANSDQLERSVTSSQGSVTQALARLQALEEAQSKAQVSAGAQVARIDSVAQDMAALKQSMAAAQDSLQAGAKDLAATRAQMQERSDRLDSLSELLDTMKKSQESDDEELVEVKQALKRLEPAPASEAGNAEWWDQILTWKYMPAVAVGLSCVATGIALSHK
jgi:chromosome segregation ATPase